MKRAIIVFTTFIVVLSAFASVAGVMSYGEREYTSVTTPRGDRIEFLTNGTYAYSSKALAAEGIPWDIVRLVFGIPFLAISFIFFIRNSLRGTLLFIGALANSFYQFLLWALAWAFNSLFLVYVVVYSLSLVTAILVASGVKIDSLAASIKTGFPMKSITAFTFVVAGFLVLLWVGKLLPPTFGGKLPVEFRGEQTAISQATDLGLIVPLTLFTGIFLLKRNPIGYLLAPAVLVFGVNMCLSILAGTIVGGLETGFMPVPVITMFVILLFGCTWLLVKAVVNISPVGYFMKFS